jgi:serine/threonine protein kinase
MNCPQCHGEVREGEHFCRNCGLAQAFSETPTVPVSEQVNDSSPPDPLLSQILDSKYQLVERLGEGGMGTVYRARRLHIGDEVAVKILLQKYVSGGEAVERFRREARAAAVLRHPNIVTIHDFGEARGADAPAYIVMELVEGTSLRNLLQCDGRLSPERAVQLLRGVCAGVGAAHRRHIVHRDLKPDNIIIVPPEREGEPETVKVIDFGIAKLRDSEGVTTLTQAGAFMGTPHYMSPEQCRGETLDERSDIYSLGAILYEMLCGTPPFIGSTLTAIVAKHLTEAAPPMAPTLAVSPALERVCLRALAKRAEERYQSVESFYEELAQALDSPRQETAAQAHVTRPVTSGDDATSASFARATNDSQVNVTRSALAPTLLADDGMRTVPSYAARQSPPNAASMVSNAANALPSARGLLPLRKFGIWGALISFPLSLAIGFFARWVRWTTSPQAYDEFVLELLTMALRDALFGAFLGIALSEFRRAGARWAVTTTDWARPLIVYGASAAAILMAPFVLLRTSLFVLPLALAFSGFVAGVLVCGIRLAVQKLASHR